jgi:hypothetical protein
MRPVESQRIVDGKLYRRGKGRKEPLLMPTAKGVVLVRQFVTGKALGISLRSFASFAPLR